MARSRACRAPSGPIGTRPDRQFDGALVRSRRDGFLARTIAVIAPPRPATAPAAPRHEAADVVEEIGPALAAGKLAVERRKRAGETGILVVEPHPQHPRVEQRQSLRADEAARAGG